MFFIKKPKNNLLVLISLYIYSCNKIIIHSMNLTYTYTLTINLNLGEDRDIDVG
jgi:hypothetical protein